MNKDFYYFYENYNSGIKENDENYEMFAGAVNKLSFDEKAKSRWELLQAIEAYARLHFETEEKYMEKYDFPYYYDHKNKHQEFMEEYENLKEMYETDQNEKFLSRFSYFVENWLQEHHLEDGVVLVNYLKMNNKNGNNPVLM